MTTVKTDHGTYTGRSVDSIVRREYGRSAQARQSADPNSPIWGQVIKPGSDQRSRELRGLQQLAGYDHPQRDLQVLARIIWVDG
ncbi:hypothetical protein [Mycobacterium xenopi]|uniref:Uncharacterized protein n=1 Tax=Mycobacterium xenopi TaxID=1789 RepID=A0AAD1M0S1_MYCXE|nr:hypothetical protein [Mycobacterium xenopi]ORX21615.1 hypothetical protein AWC32_21635 [Mycobacterium xenopi]BBU22147.1 hypothetical protein MYXE_19370 [Mycobacterium xenopi]SPX77992.1 Uncharacterised protein [Mycobacterium xenopi]